MIRSALQNCESARLQCYSASGWLIITDEEHFVNKISGLMPVIKGLAFGEATHASIEENACQRD
jgi:hypothetical protein